MTELESIHVVPCRMTGLTCCIHQLVDLNNPAQNVRRHPVWCSKWRQNRIKDKVFHACEKEYKFQEGGSKE